MNYLRKVLVLIFFVSNLFFAYASKNNSHQPVSGNLTIGNDPLNGTEIRPRMVWNCVTPMGKPGYCMPLKNCSSLLNLHNEKAASYLYNFKCELSKENKTNPFVCCGKNEIASAKSESTVEKSIEKSIEKHVKRKNCGYQNVILRTRILGGKEAALGEFPWMARLYHKDNAGVKTFGCSGFLISQKIVLTAAHCLLSDFNEILGPVREVQLGEHNTKTPIDCDEQNTTCAEKVQIIRINKTVVHPLYNVTSRHHHNDIGLIYLNKGAKICKYVSPICLLEQPDLNPLEYWISGWGATQNGRNVSPVKLKVSVPPFLYSDCINLYKTISIKIKDTQICAGGKKNEDSCTGDSGGPLMVVNENHWFAAGVVSFGLSCGREGWPAIYTNIYSYKQWITDTITEVSKDNKIKSTGEN